MALGIPQFTDALGELLDQFVVGAIEKSALVTGLADLWTQYDSVLTLSDSIQALLAIKAAMIEAARLLGIKGEVVSTAELPEAADEGDGYILRNVDDELDGHLFVRSVGLWTDFGRIVGPDGKSLLSGDDIPANALGQVGDSYVRIAPGVARLYGPKTISGWGVGQDLRGPAGPSVEIQKSATAIQWRVVGAADWVDLVPLVDLHGPSVELRTNGGMVQWRPVGASVWVDLIALAELKGPTGASFSPSAVGLFSGRAAHNGEPEDFSYLATDQGLLYFRVGGSGWSAGISFGAGKSAYQIAVDAGFSGSAVEWLASLHGADGSDGEAGAPGVNADPLDVLRVGRDVGRMLLAYSKQLDTTISTPDGRFDNFGDASGINAGASSSAIHYNTGINDFFSNTAPTPDQLPVFTSASTLGYTITATSVTEISPSSYQPWKAVDGDTSTYWVSATVTQTGVPEPVMLKLQLPLATRAATYTIKVYADIRPTHWEFLGSNNGSDWTVLDTRSGVAFANDESKTFSCTSGAYLYYALRLLEGFASTTATTQCFAIKVFNIQLVGGTGVMTLIGAADARASQPDYATLTLLARAGSGSLTPNVDLTGFVSRDGGTTFTEGVLVAQETNNGWTAYEAAGVDLRGQPAGSSLVWKVVTADTKEVRVDAVGLRADLTMPPALSFAAYHPASITYAATITPDFTTRFGAEVLLTGNVAVAAPIGGRRGVTYALELKQDGPGGRSATWAPAFDWGADGDPDLSTGSGLIDVVILYCLDEAAPRYRAAFSKG